MHLGERAVALPLQRNQRSFYAADNRGLARKHAALVPEGGQHFTLSPTGAGPESAGRPPPATEGSVFAIEQTLGGGPTRLAARTRHGAPAPLASSSMSFDSLYGAHGQALEIRNPFARDKKGQT